MENNNTQTIDFNLDDDPTVQQTLDEHGTIIGDSFSKEMAPQEAMTVMGILSQMGMDDKSEMSVTQGRALVTIHDITPDELSRLQRKINIATWSQLTIKVAKTVTNFAADVADYALNGAVAPTAVAVADAAITTGRVVGTAAVKAGAGIVASGFRNGRAAVNEVWNSAEIRDCGAEIGRCWAGISSKLFGGSSSASGWAKTA